MATEAVKQKVQWINDKGKNTITRDEALGDLLNAVANWRDPNAPKIFIEKDFASTTLSIGEKLAKMEPAMYKVDCPLAAKIGIPISLYAYPEAKAGEPPTKGEPNMIASLLARRLDDGPSRSIRGKALLCLEDPKIPANQKDLPMDLIVKLLFFTVDCMRDTLGHVKGEALALKLKDAPVLFHFYGPGRSVLKQMTELRVTDPSRGPNGPVPVFPVDALREQLMQAQLQQQQVQGQRTRGPGMPVFMQEPYFQSPAYVKQLKEVVLRGWTPPSAASPEPPGGADPAGSKAGGDGGLTELTFDDLKIN